MTENQNTQTASPRQGRWFRRSWFVVLMLFLFFPIGLILAWTGDVSKKGGQIWDKARKLLMTVVFGLLFAAYVYTNYATEKDADQGEVAQVQESGWSRERFYQAYKSAGLPALPPGEELPIDTDESYPNKPNVIHWGSKVGIEGFHVQLAGNPNDLEFIEVSLPADKSGPKFVKLIRALTGETSTNPPEAFAKLPEPMQNLFRTTGAAGSPTATQFIFNQAQMLVNNVPERDLTKEDIPIMPFHKITIYTNADRTAANFWLKE
ncbi:MAG: hypothetical protein HYT87_03690 [Nitrospirae bacterium]|nr:hypothetical protein [Nitrospirota bacterium]